MLDKIVYAWFYMGIASLIFMLLLTAFNATVDHFMPKKIKELEQQLAKQAEQIKELRTTVSDQTEVINTERIINSEQAEQLKKCQEIAMALGVEHNEKNNVIAKQAEIIKVLKDCVETIVECEVTDTAAKLCSKATLKRVKILTAKYKGKENRND